MHGSPYPAPNLLPGLWKPYIGQGIDYPSPARCPSQAEVYSVQEKRQVARLSYRCKASSALARHFVGLFGEFDHINANPRGAEQP